MSDNHEHHDHERDDDEIHDGLDRRAFLELLGASLALAGIGACSRPPAEKIVPYSQQPEDVTPGLANHYATAIELDGLAEGLLVESHEGRPTKIEGNPRHPSSLGATSVLAQASLLQLYDPHRGRNLSYRRSPRAWRALADALARLRREGKTHFVLEPTSSPTIAALIERARQDAQFHFLAPITRSSIWEGARLVLGRPLETRIDLRVAEVIVTFDDDLLADLAHARNFADLRRVQKPQDAMNRLYTIESTPTCTGIAADHRIRARRSEIPRLVATLLAEIAPHDLPENVSDALAKLRMRESDERRRIFATIARDLVAHRDTALVTAGSMQPPIVHALVHLLNRALGSKRVLVHRESPILEAGAKSHDPRELRRALDSGEVRSIVLLGGNPCYIAPRDLELGRRIRALDERVFVGLYENETARECNWFVPETHYLEGWGDARAFDGTASIVQPLIAPLYGGRTRAEVLAMFVGAVDPGSHGLVRDTWRREHDGHFEDFWTTSLRDGLIAETSTKPIDTDHAQPSWDAILAALGSLDREDGSLEITFHADRRVGDGRFSNVSWLLELPDPVTKLTWGNAALVSPATAARMSLEHADVIELSVASSTVRAPVVIVPGQADESVAISFGWGRDGEEKLARNIGFDAYALRTLDAFDRGGFAMSASVHKTGACAELALTQRHDSMEERPIVLHSTLARFREDSSLAAEHRGPSDTLYKLPLASEHQWGMAIDLNACTGCSACVVACQAENNVPVVGHAGVRASRAMHWLRIDRYYSEAEEILLQPMLCQHCEKAPCEYVCPVNATVHSPDGLNEQVYNRCIGTRFCSNNCPYKVRRFNWFNYHRDITETLRMAMNPDVTVRDRGVMEKCTFCVQRIRRAQIDARIDRRAITDGEVVTACAQACPTRAITFGNIADRTSAVSRLQKSDRAYEVLHELGTEPRVRYLLRLRNENPELAPARGPK